MLLFFKLHSECSVLMRMVLPLLFFLFRLNNFIVTCLPRGDGSKQYGR